MSVFIDQHRDVFGVEPICRVLGIAPSTYYAVCERRRRPAPRTLRDRELLTEIRRVHEASSGLYGARKVWWQLTHDGIIDAFSRRIVGCKADTTMRTGLVLDTLEMALWSRERAGLPAGAGLIPECSARRTSRGSVRCGSGETVPTVARRSTIDDVGESPRVSERAAGRAGPAGPRACATVVAANSGGTNTALARGISFTVGSFGVGVMSLQEPTPRASEGTAGSSPNHTAPISLDHRVVSALG